MFKKFSPAESISGQSQAKSSVQRHIRKLLAESMPLLEPHLDELLPRKAPLYVAKCSGHVSLVIVNKEPLFYQIRDAHYMPTLRVLHRFPDILPKAIKFVLKGADIMCPGLTSAGGRLDVSLATDVPVAVQAEGKTHAVAIGITKLSSDDIRSINKGTGIETIHFLNDGLWQTTTLE